jgi:hypothetical protein
MPEITFDSIDAVPEGLREFAKEEEGKFTVAVAPAARLAEFRDNNIRFQKERDDLAKERDGLTQRIQKYSKVIGEDFDKFSKEYEELRTIQKRVKDGELVMNSSLEEVLSKRVAEMKAEYDSQLEARGKEAEDYKGKYVDIETRYNQKLIDSEVVTAILDPKNGVRPEALEDIKRRAYEAFRIKDGKPIPFAGDQPVYGKDGVTPITASDWIAKMKDSAPHYFKESKGGGADPGAGGGGGGQLGADAIGNMSMAEYMKARREGKI